MCRHIAHICSPPPSSNPNISEQMNETNTETSNTFTLTHSFHHPPHLRTRSFSVGFCAARCLPARSLSQTHIQHTTSLPSSFTRGTYEMWDCCINCSCEYSQMCFDVNRHNTENIHNTAHST